MFQDFKIGDNTYFKLHMYESYSNTECIIGRRHWNSNIL